MTQIVVFACDECDGTPSTAYVLQCDHIREIDPREVIDNKTEAVYDDADCKREESESSGDKVYIVNLACNLIHSLHSRARPKERQSSYG